MKLSSASNYRWRFKGLKKHEQANIQRTHICRLLVVLTNIVQTMK